MLSNKTPLQRHEAASQDTDLNPLSSKTIKQCALGESGYGSRRQRKEKPKEKIYHDTDTDGYLVLVVWQRQWSMVCGLQLISAPTLKIEHLTDRNLTSYRRAGRREEISFLKGSSNRWNTLHLLGLCVVIYGCNVRSFVQRLLQLSWLRGEGWITVIRC